METVNKKLGVHGGFTEWLYRPYIDLGPKDTGPSHIYCVEFAFENLQNVGMRRERPQRVLPHSFRESLLRETGLAEYRVADPLDLPTELRSERWRYLCEFLSNYHALNFQQQADVLAVLTSLCLYPAVVKYAPQMPGEEIARGEAHAMRAYARANARFMLSIDYDTEYGLDEFKSIAMHAPLGGVIRFNALIHLIVQSARFAKDADAVEHWAAVALGELNEVRSKFDDFTYTLLMSRYYRAAAFGPQLRGDRAGLVQQMNLAEEYATSIPRDTDVHRILADENLHPLMQSRTKEALWLGDLDLAEHRSRRVLEIDPMDPRARMEVGEVLATKGKLAEAAALYGSAAELGPPGTAIAWYMAGECYQALGQLEHACDCFFSSLRIDPLGISAAERLVDLARQMGNPALVRWTELRLVELQDQEAKQLH